jgi:FKBP-type peptidyl-prolyl cis-trans isomerase SlyD
MQIAQHTVVTLNYTLTDEDGGIIDQSQEGSFAYLHGASNIIPGLENALAGKRAGDQLQVSVEPAEGYGEHNDDLMQVVPRDAFPEGEVLEPGMQFHAQGPDGQPIVVTIAAVEGDEVTIDGNHPLAGTTLNFDVTVIEVRAATEEEKSHGHVHGAHGHDH